MKNHQSERIDKMTIECVFCGLPVQDRKKGDHIIPQGLGTFYPEVTVFNICRNCDRNHGGSFEQTFLRTGFIAFLRSRHKIKSKNNKSRPAHNPSFERSNSIESKAFRITSSNYPHKEVYFSKIGELRHQNFIRIITQGEEIGTINLPISYDIRDICNFIESKGSIKPHDALYELHLSIEVYESVTNELARRGVGYSPRAKVDRVAEIENVDVDFVVTENHFKTICYTVLKALLFLKYQKSLLQPMIDFIKNSNLESIIHGEFDLINSGTNASDNPPLNIFYHHFEWNIGCDSIWVTGKVFAHRNVNGLKFNLQLKTGATTEIIIPHGQIIANYRDGPHNGTIQIYRGDSKVVG
ncbi:MAG: hypothetical protein IPK50_06460 [Fibrobacterota bacterium]|nr:MAG: hypothetical protein IPK50_06460 [Fibrobacterota bacterium]